MHHKSQVFKSNFVIVIYFFSLALFLSCSDVNVENTSIIQGIVIQGTVIDKTSGERIKNVIVTLGKDRRVITEEDGVFKFENVDAVAHVIRFYKYRYDKYDKTVNLPNEKLVIKLSPYSIMEPDIESASINFQKGWRLAEEELRSNNASIYVSGFRSGRYRKDAYTGLPQKSISGCIETEEYNSIQAGHNQRILKHIAENGLPVSYKFSEKLFQRKILIYATTSNKKLFDSLWNSRPKVFTKDSLYNFEFSDYAGGRYLFLNSHDTSIVFQIPAHFQDTLILFWGPEDLNSVFIFPKKSFQNLYMIDLDRYQLHLVTGSSSYLIN